MGLTGKKNDTCCVMGGPLHVYAISTTKIVSLGNQSPLTI